MARSIVKRHMRKGKPVRTYYRTKRPKSKRKIITKEKYTLVRDEYGQVKGYKG